MFEGIGADLMELKSQGGSQASARGGKPLSRADRRAEFGCEIEDFDSSPTLVDKHGRKWETSDSD